MQKILFGRGLFVVALGVAAFACTGRPLLPVEGDPSGTAREEFRQTENTAATILWVIDNSGSMCEEQFNVRNNIQEFVNAFTLAAPGATFHMGVIDTDTVDPTSRGRLQNTYMPTAMTALCTSPPPALDCVTGLPSPLPKWVDETNVVAGDIESIFGCLTSRGITGYGGETALGAVRMGLSPGLLNDPMANAGFYIPGSLMVIIFLGDEDDCSVCSGTTCSPLPSLGANLECSIDRVTELTPVQDFVAYIGALNPTGTKGTLAATGLLVAAIIGLDPQGNSAGPVIPDPGGMDSLVPICAVAGQGSAAPAPRIEAFTRGFDDYLEYNICDSDFGTALAEIATRIGALLSSGCLQSRPCPGTTALDVVVRVTDSAGTRELTPADPANAVTGDYDVVCATAGNACPASADAVCAEGWRIEFIKTVEPGAEVEVIYGFDAGDMCGA